MNRRAAYQICASMFNRTTMFYSKLSITTWKSILQMKSSHGKLYQPHIHKIKLEQSWVLTLKLFNINFTQSEEAKLSWSNGLISTLPDQFRQLTNLICHVIYNYDAVGSAVVTGSDGAKPLLTCGVPLRYMDRDRNDSKGQKINTTKYSFINNMNKWSNTT